MRQLSRAPAQYDERDQLELRRVILDADKENLKRGADIELKTARLFKNSPDGSRWEIVVDNAGNLSAVPA